MVEGASFAVHAVLEIELRLDHVSETHVEPPLVEQLLETRVLARVTDSWNELRVRVDLGKPKLLLIT